jgi:hypothetical protein
MTDAELLRALFEQHALAGSFVRAGTDLALIDALTLACHYGAGVRGLLDIALRQEDFKALFCEPGLPELRQLLRRLHDLEAKIGLPDDRRLPCPWTKAGDWQE